jgi:hypothetical protein
MGRNRIRSGISEKWNRGLPPAEDLAWRKILELFATKGRAPSVLEIAKSIGVSGEQARTILADLQAHDLLGLDKSATAITYAYPFSVTPTEHFVELYDRHLHAVCAIDALGIAGMFRTDGPIRRSSRPAAPVAVGSRLAPPETENL